MIWGLICSSVGVSECRPRRFFRRAQKPKSPNFRHIPPKNDKREMSKKEIWPTNGLHSQGHNFSLQNVSFSDFENFRVIRLGFCHIIDRPEQLNSDMKIYSPVN